MQGLDVGLGMKNVKKMTTEFCVNSHDNYSNSHSHILCKFSKLMGMF